MLKLLFIRAAPSLMCALVPTKEVPWCQHKLSIIYFKICKISKFRGAIMHRALELENITMDDAALLLLISIYEWRNLRVVLPPDRFSSGQSGFSNNDPGNWFICPVFFEIENLQKKVL